MLRTRQSGKKAPVMWVAAATQIEDPHAAIRSPLYPACSIEVLLRQE